MSNEDDDLYMDNQEIAEFNPWDGTQSPPIDDGRYILIGTEVERKSAKGGTQLAYTFEVEANADGTETAHAGSKVWNRYNEFGKGMGRLVQLFEATGVDYKKGGYSPRAALNKKFIAQLTKRTYQKRVTHDDGTESEVEKWAMDISSEEAINEPKPKAVEKPKAPSAPAKNAKGGQTSAKV